MFSILHKNSVMTNQITVCQDSIFIIAFMVTTYLRACTFTNSKNPILIRMEAHSNFAHWLRICDGSWEVPLPIQPTKQSLPVIVSLSCVWQAPWYQINNLSSRQLYLHFIRYHKLDKSQNGYAKVLFKFNFTFSSGRSRQSAPGLFGIF